MRAFGTALRNIRKELGLNQAQLAERADTTVASVCKYETGASCPSVTMLFELANALGLKPSEILSRTETELDARRN